MPAPVWTIRKREKLTCIYPRNDQYTFLLETHLILNASFYLILILFYFILFYFILFYLILLLLSQWNFIKF